MRNKDVKFRFKNNKKETRKPKQITVVLNKKKWSKTKRYVKLNINKHETNPKETTLL